MWALDRVHRRHRFSVADVDRMTEAGVFGADDRIELLHGTVVDVGQQGPEHAWTGDELHAVLARTYGDDYWIRDQRPLTLGPYSRPEPDLAIVRAGDYRHAHATGRDAVLVVEVAWSSGDLDRAKADLYAAGGVPVYWIVDVASRQLLVHRDPTETGYRRIETLREHDIVELPEVVARLRVGDLLP